MKHSLATLTFAEIDAKGQILTLWRSDPQAPYAAACDEGRRRAEEVVRLMEQRGDPNLLGHVVSAIVGSTAAMGGIEIGFFARIAALAIEGVLVNPVAQVPPAATRPPLHLAVDNPPA